MLNQRSLHWLRSVAAVLDVASLVSGGVALFAIENAAGSLFLLTLGTVVLLVSVLGRRIEPESLEILGANIKVREVVMSRLDLAGLDVAVHPPAAMGAQALTLQKLAGLHDLYESSVARRAYRTGERRLSMRSLPGCKRRDKKCRSTLRMCPPGFIRAATRSA